MWRVLTHTRAPASLIEVEERWSIEDLLEANIALDVWDELERRAAEEANRAVEQSRRGRRF